MFVLTKMIFSNNVVINVFLVELEVFKLMYCVLHYGFMNIEIYCRNYVASYQRK
jgi:hypothetical protein